MAQHHHTPIGLYGVNRDRFTSASFEIFNGVARRVKKRRKRCLGFDPASLTNKKGVPHYKPRINLRRVFLVI
jgi:hypothetical protein